MATEVRAGLSPGLYAIFDIIGSDVLRTVSAALDGQGRVLFRGLYEDWGKFGKWKD